MPITNDQLAQQLGQVHDQMTDFTAAMFAWANGVAGGGQASNGKYPLPTGLGTYTQVPCPAQIQVDANKLRALGYVQLNFTPGFTGSNSSYTFKPGDNGAVMMLQGSASSTAVTLTLPDTLPVGFSVGIIQNGTGKITFTTGPNGVLQNRQGQFSTAGQGSFVIAICSKVNSGPSPTFTIGGDVTV